MDDRLWIHNGVIGLAHPSPPWPHPLHAVGYRLVRIEQPVGTAKGEVSVDVLLLAEARNALLAVECKDGTVQERQANAYEAMTALDVVQTANITVPEASLAALDVVYAVPPSRAESTVEHLGDRRIGVLVIGSTIEWRGHPPNDSGLATAFAGPISADARAIARLLPADDASPAAAIALEIANAIHAAVEQGRESVTVSALVEQACWGWPRYGRAFKGGLIRRVQALLREAAKETLKDVIVFERAGGQSDPTIRFVIPPTEASTQAGELRAARAVRLKLDSFVAWATGQPVPAIPGQLEIQGLDETLGDDDDDDEEVT
jgi:hypothetical protein